MNSTEAVGMQEEAVGFGERLVAYLIDGVALTVVYVVLAVIFPLAIYYLLALIIGAAYAVGFWATTGQTPGKMVMKIKVVDAETGEVPDAGKAILRYVGYLVSSIPLGLGFFWVLWDEKREAWHDKMVKTRVVRAER